MDSYQAVRGGMLALLYRLSPELLAHYRFRMETGRPLDLKNPRTFDEKLLWLMLFWTNPLKTQCADKYAMRTYVQGQGYGHLLTELLGVYERGSEIDFDPLPDRFVLKCTHGCGFNIICKDKSRLDRQDTRQRLDAWIKDDFSEKYGEIHYAGIQPRIICEAYQDDSTGILSRDYKVHCFHGRVHFTTVCAERGLDGSGAIYDHYDRQWKIRLPYSKRGLPPCEAFPEPEAYAAMLAAAEALSKPFPYVRMDFYGIRGRAVLGEMTFTPAGCIDTGYRDEVQRLLGDLITLPEKRLRW
jgi:hypothetical protein